MQDDTLEGLEGAPSIEIGSSEPLVAEEPRTLGFPFPNLSTDYHYVLSSGQGEAKIGSRGCYVYLNKVFAQRAFDLILSREQYCQMRDEAKTLLNQLGFPQNIRYAPLQHFSAHSTSKKGLISDLSLGGISSLDFSMNRQDFRDITEGRLKQGPRYHTIGLTDSKRSTALQELWMFWISQMRSYGVSSS